MGHCLSKVSIHQNQTQSSSLPDPPNNSSIPSSSSSPSAAAIDFESNSANNNNINSNASSSSAAAVYAAAALSSQSQASSYVFAANAPHPSPSVPNSPSPHFYYPPLFSSGPPPYVDHQSAKKIKNDVNIHKDSIKLFHDNDNNNMFNSYLVSFTFDALVDGSITIFYFAKEGPNCTFMPLYPDIYMPMRIPFQKGLAQKFCQPSGTGIDLGSIELDLLSMPSKQDDTFPLVISAEASLVFFSADSGLQYQPAQITQAVLNTNCEGQFQVKVIKQILWSEGIRYELREIYGIGNSIEQGLDGSEPGKQCVICMIEPKDTAVLPCRHLCMCSGCAQQMRFYHSKRCPICRGSIQELIEIKIQNQARPAV